MKHSPLKGTTTFLYSSNLSSFFYFLKTCYLRLLLKEKKIIYIYIVVCSLDTKNSCNHPSHVHFATAFAGPGPAWDSSFLLHKSHLRDTG